MAERKWLITMPLMILLGASGLAIAIVPGIRDWLDHQFPQLGINGPISSALSQEPLSTSRSIPPTINPPLPLESSPMELPNNLPLVSVEGPLVEDLETPVRFAQATFPVVLQQQSTAPQLPPRQTNSQLPNGEQLSQQSSGLPAVPNSGLSVPVSSSSNGTLIVERASLEFVKDIRVAAQTDGLITKLFVDEGTMVKQGEAMIEIDSRLATAEANVNEKELESAMFKAEDESGLKFAKAALEVAERELEISNDVMNKGAEGPLENLKKRLEMKKAGFQVDVSETQKKTDSKAVEVQEAKLAASNVQLELRKIPAHWDGMVSEVEKEQYDFVRTGEVILRLTSMKTIRVKGSVAVQDAPHLLLNAPAVVTVMIAPGKSLRIDGKVGFVAPRASAPNSYPIHVEIPNRPTEDGQYLFREGMTASIEIRPNSR